MKRSSRSPENSSSKRYHREDKQENGPASDEDSYVPYVPLKERRKEKLEKFRRNKAPEQEAKAAEDEKVCSRLDKLVYQSRQSYWDV